MRLAVPCLLEEVIGVLRHATESNLKMQMRPGRAPGVADFSDQLTALDDVARFHQHARGMCVARGHVVAVVYFDHIAVIGVKCC